MKICVTGGCGFIGSHVVDILIDNGYEVFVIDNLSTGKRENLRSGIKLYEKDIREDLKSIFSLEKPSILVHLAAQINVRESLKNPVFDADVNVLGSINLIKTAVESGIKKVVYSSSGGAIYGEPEKLPCNEEHSINPLSPYGVSKYTVEKYLEYFNKMYGIGYTILRYSNVFGERQDPAGEAGVVSIFFDRAVNEQNLLIYGDGKQTRDFVYVKDVAKANLIAVEKEPFNDSFNIGSGIPTSINELAEKIKEISGKNVEIQHGDAIHGEVKHIYLDCKKALDRLGWRSEVNLDKGLKKIFLSF